MGERGSSSEMENDMENVRLLLLRPGGTMAPKAPSIPHRGAGPVFLGTFSDTQTHIHILTACAQRSTTTHIHMSHIHIQGHAYVVCFQKHTSKHIKEETRLEMYTNPGRYTTSCLIIHTYYQTDTTGTHTM